jgi:hypothetical protein
MPLPLAVQKSFCEAQQMSPPPLYPCFLTLSDGVDVNADASEHRNERNSRYDPDTVKLRMSFGKRHIGELC